MQDHTPLLKKAYWILMTCFFAALLTACSTVRIGYNHGNSLVYWWLDAYVDFGAAQQPMMKRDIDSLLAWHRKTQLTQYGQFLSLVQRQLTDGVSHAELQADFDQIEGFSKTMLLKAVPELSDLALALSDVQIRHLEKKFNDSNDEFRKKYMQDPLPKQQKQRFKRVLSEAESWFGSFSREQEEKIRLLSDARPSNNQIWFDERIARQQKIVALLHQLRQEKPSQELTQAMLKKFINANFERNATPERKAHFDAYNEASLQMILAIIKDASPSQKANANKKLQGWIDDVNFLAAENK